MGRSTKRATAARLMVRAALDFGPASPSPAAALRELVHAIAEGWFDGSPTEAILALLDDRDEDFETLMVIGAGISLEPAEPELDPQDALQEHIRSVGWRISIRDDSVNPRNLGRLVSLVALVRHRGCRRQALRDLTEQRDELFAAMLKLVTGIEL